MKNSNGHKVQFSWQGIFPAITFLAVVIGSIMGWPNWSLLAIIALLPVHFIILPRLAQSRSQSMERKLTKLIANGKNDKALSLWNRSIVVRLYAPPIYRWTRKAMIHTAQGQLVQAEELYVLALNKCEKQQKPIIMTNLAAVKEKLGKHREAKGLREEAIKITPGLANLVNTASQTATKREL